MDFTRLRKLSFSTIFILLLKKSVKSIQLILNEYFLEQEISDTITASAFTQARHKLKHTAFIALNEGIVDSYYNDNKNIKTFFGFRCVGIDRSNIILPNIKDIRDEFGFSKIKNQANNDLGSYNHASCVCCYDVLNNIVIKTCLEHCKNYEVDSAIKMIDIFDQNDLLILDRGYASYKMLATLIDKGKNYIIRLPKSSFKAITSMFKNLGPWNKIVTLQIPKELVSANKVLKLPETIKVRFIRVFLSTGETKILATSINNENITRDDFKKLYWLRWGVETFFGKIKGRLALENFTGKTIESIKQDFWSTILISNIETIMTEDLENTINIQNQETKHKKQINKAVSFNVIKSMAFDIFVEENDTDIIINKLEKLFITNPILERPGKTIDRTVKAARKSLNYQKRLRKYVF